MRCAMTTHIHPPPRQAGFSMLEVLITMVVIALGLLGFAGLQAYSMKSNQLALNRSIATMYAYSIIDSMRANRNQALANSYDIVFGAVPAAVQPAQADLTIWVNDLAGNLPNGQGNIVVNGATNVATVTIHWNENVSTTEQKQVTFTTATKL
jgi:type IV pilus assembly protein PilV